MDDVELIARFKGYGLTEKQQKEVDGIRADALRLATRIDAASADSREKSLSITAIEEAVMWSTRSICRNGRR